MKILQIAPEFPPNSLGGGGQVIKALTEGLEAKGEKIVVVSALFNVHGFFDRSIRTNLGKTTVVWLPLVPPPKVGFQLKSYLPPNIFSCFYLLKIFLRRDFDIVHIHGFSHFFCDFAAVLSRLSKKPYIYTLHGFPKEPDTRGGVLRFLYKLYVQLLAVPSVSKASRIIVVSESLAKESAPFFPNRKFEVIPNGINPSCKDRSNERKMREVKAKYELEGKIVILGLGRLCSIKGFQFAIRALPEVLEKASNVVLVIAGADDGYGYSRELFRLVEENKVKPHVRFIGRITDEEEKNALLWSTDVVVIPSTEESFGLVAVEAMGAGRLIVASRVGGLAETLSTDKYTWLTDGGNVKQLSGALIAAVTNLKLKPEAEAARNLRLAKFDMNTMAESYHKLYASMSIEIAKSS